jgi:glycosyltransferase involved in cell wall biosynthesis
MFRAAKISVVIPCYNEEEGIARVIPSLPKSVDEIIIVDNNSTDRTAEIARSLGARVVFEATRGYGAAYKAGLSAVTGDVTVTMDGDGSYPADQVEECVAYLLDGDLDFVIASRFPLDDASAMKFSNKIGNAILTFTMLLLFMKNVKDSQSGMWIFRSALYPKIAPKSDGMVFSEEIKLNAIVRRHLKFGEYHIRYHPRIGEVKLRKWRDGFRNLSYLLKFRCVK